MFCWWYSRIDAPSVASWGDRAVRGLAQAVGLVVTMGVNVLIEGLEKRAENRGRSQRIVSRRTQLPVVKRRPHTHPSRRMPKELQPKGSSPALCIAGLASRSLPPLGTPVLPKQLR